MVLALVLSANVARWRDAHVHEEQKRKRHDNY